MHCRAEYSKSVVEMFAIKNISICLSQGTQWKYVMNTKQSYKRKATFCHFRFLIIS